MEQSKQFRTAGFGGFHRQDVLDYIQRTAKEQSEQRETLKKELQEAEARIAALTASNTDLRTERDQARDQLAQVARERESWQLPEGMTVEKLLEEWNTLREQAGLYAQMKSDYAEIEVEARRRSSLLISRAEMDAAARVSNARAEADALLAAAHSEAEALSEQTRAACEAQLAEARAEADRTVLDAQAEAHRTREALRQQLERTSRDFYTGSADLTAGVTQAQREIEQLRQDLAGLAAVFEENARAVEELCGEPR